MPVRLLALAVGAFVINTGSYLIAGVLPAVAAHLDVPVTTAGQLVTVHAFTYAISAPLLSGLAGRWERRQLLWLSLGLFVVGSLGTAVAPDFGSMTAARILAALGASLFTPTAVVIASDLVPLDRRGRAVSVVLSGLTLATVIGVPLGVLLVGPLGYKGLFAMVALLGVLASAVLLVLPRVPAPEPAASGQRLAPLRNRAVVWVLVVSLLGSLADFAAYTYASPMLGALTGAGATTVGLLLFVYGAAGAAGNVVVGRITDRYGSTVGIVGSLLVLAIGLAFLPLAGFSVVAMGTLLVLWGFGGWGIMPAVQHRLISLAPTATAMVIALNSSALYFGMGLGGFTGGAVVAEWGWGALGPAAAVVSVLALVLFRRMPSDGAVRQHRDAPENDTTAEERKAEV
ncbi:DHA1 family purine base/nucleoside efflux pump-like MFS transporter [Saccharopolyspora lacisalsi]|uniref:DHA1 family purine base/nucleoside efflux pump-like MFS transporter n=1 Tax=Halosaccharopolyspora lacisalsi TaxID=1000566 RepID=A0A839E2E8_9PSEU|nr:MFS transporter [Halosaccharopolyspora lacisalsi]MBA8827443.1 DHA1 family purine base/nucleoside efflux pump-like MFS transporter [Halosaccharopolyspora lacisalsi]